MAKVLTVVSADIQSLADEAAENVEQIKDLIKAIQDQTMSVKTDLTNVAESASREVMKAKQTTQDVEQIATDINEVVQYNQAMKERGEEIAAGVTQAQRGLEQIATANEQASSNCQQALNAADQQSKGMECWPSPLKKLLQWQTKCKTANR